MGGSSSKTSINQLSQALTNVAMSSVQDCQVSATQTQNLSVNNTGFRLWGTYHLDQQSEIRSDCFSDVAKQADLQNKIISTIAQSTTAQSIALLGAFGTSASDASANLSNIVKNNVTMSNIQKSYNTLKQTQNASFNNSGVVGFEQVDLTQGSKLFAAATLQEIDKAGVFNQISSYLDQQSSATQANPLDFIAKAIGAVSSSLSMSILFFIIIIAVAVLGAVVVIKMLTSGPPPRIMNVPAGVTHTPVQISNVQ